MQSVFGLYVKRSRVDFYGILFFAVYYYVKTTLHIASLLSHSHSNEHALSHTHYKHLIINWNAPQDIINVHNTIYTFE